MWLYEEKWKNQKLTFSHVGIKRDEKVIRNVAMQDNDSFMDEGECESDGTVFKFLKAFYKKLSFIILSRTSNSKA